MNSIEREIARELVLCLLDNDEGVSEDSFNLLKMLCKRTSNVDILDFVNATDGRFYLCEGAAESLRHKEDTGFIT